MASCPWATALANNPASDSWTPLPATGSPSARFAHSAVWTGSEMILYGGRASSARAPTGALRSQPGYLVQYARRAGGGERALGRVDRHRDADLRRRGSNDTPSIRASATGPADDTILALPTSGRQVRARVTARSGRGRRCWCGAARECHRRWPTGVATISPATRGLPLPSNRPHRRRAAASCPCGRDRVAGLGWDRGRLRWPL